MNLTTNVDAFEPVAVGIPGKPAPAEKNTSARNSGMLGTLIFSHSVVESNISAERSVTEDGGSLSAEDGKAGVGIV